MMFSSTIASLLLASVAVASPVQLVERQAAAASSTSQLAAVATVSPPFPIHSSCNATSRTQLAKGLRDTIKLAETAKAYLLQYGRNGTLTQKYFGNASTAEPIGWYERVISADRANMLFRCDDPDRNCATQDGWGGHWRGSNATSETVICPLSFSTRRPLEQICGLGTTVARSPINTFFAVDLMHRIFHVNVISEDVVEHYAGNYTEVMALAKANSPYSTVDSDTLQLFAWEVYAYVVAVPGVGCSGDSSSSAGAAVASSTSRASSAVAAVTSAAAAVGAGAATGTTSAASSCHTHADGQVHCV